MSYSFTFRATTKHEARTHAREEFAKIVEFQPVHIQDQELALTALELYLGVLTEDDSRDIQVAMHGSISYEWAAELVPAEVPLVAAAVSVSAHFVPKE